MQKHHLASLLIFPEMRRFDQGIHWKRCAFKVNKSPLPGKFNAGGAAAL
jgi:hypothetical protein